MRGQRPVTQQAQGHPMERRGLDRFADVESPQTALQLGSRVARESQRQHVPCLSSAMRHPVGNATSEHCGLARSGGGDDGKRRRGADHSFALFRVEADQHRIASYSIARHRVTIEDQFSPVASSGSQRPRTTVAAMPYPKKNLNADETIALDMHPHWWYFAEPATALVIVIVLGILQISKGPEGDTGDVLKKVLIGLLILSALWVVGRYLKWITTNFVMTSQRLIFRQGIIAKSGIEIPLDRVNNVNFNQSIFERILGAGDLLIESGGEDGQQRFTDIRNPEKVQNLLHAQVEITRGRSGARGPARASDPSEQLERLEGMLKRGTLTQAEFDSQKRKLLD